MDITGDLKCKRHQTSIIVAFYGYLLILIIGLMTHDFLPLQWRGKISNDAIKQPLNTDILQRRSDKHGVKLSGQGSLSNGFVDHLGTYRLIMNVITETAKLEVTDEELEEEIKTQAEQSNMTPEQARENIEKNNMLGYLRSQMLDRKLYDMLLEHAEKKKGEKIKYLDLMQSE